MKERNCPKCGKPSRVMTKGVCNNCYRRFFWDKPKKTCPRCKREVYLKSKGLCSGCYNTVYNLEYHKAVQCKKRYNISYEKYKKITEKCVLCGFDKIVELHHLDQNEKNNSDNNLIGLCPNHHQMLHSLKYKNEIFQLLKEKGFNPQEKKFRQEIKGGY